MNHSIPVLKQIPKKKESHTEKEEKVLKVKQA